MYKIELLGLLLGKSSEYLNLYNRDEKLLAQMGHNNRIKKTDTGACIEYAYFAGLGNNIELVKEIINLEEPNHQNLSFIDETISDFSDELNELNEENEENEGNELNELNEENEENEGNELNELNEGNELDEENGLGEERENDNLVSGEADAEADNLVSGEADNFVRENNFGNLDDAIRDMEPQRDAILSLSLFGACYGGHLELIKILLGEYEKRNKIPLYEEMLYYASLGSSENVIDYFLSSFPDRFDLMDGLSGATNSGDKELMDKFLNMNASLWDRLSLSSASSNDRELIDYLLSNGVNDYNNGLMRAIDDDNIEGIKYMVSLGANNFDNALIMACSACNFELIQYFIEQGASISDLVIIEAIIGGELNGGDLVGIVNYLLGYGVRLNNRDLKRALKCISNEEVKNILLDHHRYMP